MATINLILGGARRGKSRFAQQLAEKVGGDDVLFAATAQADDGEMTRRIQKYRDSRPAGWETLEVGHDAGGTLTERDRKNPVILVDCLVLLVSNVLLNQGDEPELETAEQGMRTEVDLLLNACGRPPRLLSLYRERSARDWCPIIPWAGCFATCSAGPISGLPLKLQPFICLSPVTRSTSNRWRKASNEPPPHVLLVPARTDL